MSESLVINVSADQISRLDMSPLQELRQRPATALLELEDGLALQLEWPRADDDPRELSEVPECRLWSLRADALCPWLTLLLQRSDGQLSRHVAMQVLHEFSRTEGLRFDPDDLSLWISHRLFWLDDWGNQHGLALRGRLGQMAAVLGFNVEAGFWPQA
jgi:hypothetical protein